MIGRIIVAAAVVSVLASALAGACGGRPVGEAQAPQPTPPGTTAVYTRYAAADAIIVADCAGCHSRAGKHPDQERAHQVLALDSYSDWHSQTTVIAAVLDAAHPDGNIMPPAYAPAQPTEAERALLLDWTRRGAPDTPDGR